MTLWWQKQFHLSLYIAFSTKVATRLEIIMEITKKKKNTFWKPVFLKAGILFQKYLSTDDPAKFRLSPLFFIMAKEQKEKQLEEEEQQEHQFGGDLHHAYWLQPISCSREDLKEHEKINRKH